MSFLSISDDFKISLIKASSTAVELQTDLLRILHRNSISFQLRKRVISSMPDLCELARLRATFRLEKLL